MVKMVMAEAAKARDRDRTVALTVLLALAALAWVYLWVEAGRMDAMAGDGGMPVMGPWSPPSLLLTFLMWSVMMVGMMLPSAVPAIALYGAMMRGRRAGGSALGLIWSFAAGYLLVWVAFSLAATVLQAAFLAERLLTPAMVSASSGLTGVLLVGAGVYQWLPAKNACLQHCRSPLSFFLFRWRPGAMGALRMGTEHGLFCVGCCWALMLLLFTAGVMNLLWVALITAFVWVEKVAPAGRFVGRFAGIVLVMVGGGIVVADL